MADIITVAGNVATAPEFKTTASGVPIVSFRLASAQRHFDRASGSWVDDGTNWYTVSAFRGLAEHLAASVSKGEPLIVTGRLRLREWEAGGKKGISTDIDAEAAGHDLRWGTSAYSKHAPAQQPLSADTVSGASDGESWAPAEVEADGPAGVAAASATPF